MRALTHSTILTSGLLFLSCTITPPADAQTFNSFSSIPVSDAQTVGTADPYPASINVSGLTGTIVDINVELVGFTHTFADDLDILLVAPNGTAQVILSDAGGDNDFFDIDVILDDEAAAAIPDAGPIGAGSFRVSTYSAGDSYPAPAPGPGAGVNLAAFDGIAPNGTWSVYVVDDTNGDVGLFVGVMLQITTTGNTLTPFSTSGGIRAYDPGGFGSSSITVTGVASPIDGVRVTLSGVTHANPDDLDIYLVSPHGITFGLMSDTGGTNSLTPGDFVNIVFDDDAPALLPDATVITAGSYRPTNYGIGDRPRVPPLPPYNEPAPADATPATFSSLFDGLNPNGTWTLCVTDDAVANTGSIVAGWSLQIITLPPRFLAYGITSTHQLVTFDTQVPGVLTSTKTITGLVGGDTITGLDIRPANGQLFGLGSGSRVYRIDPVTAVATQVGSSGAFTLNGQAFGFDFNPVADLIRVNSDSEQNLRLSPDAGTLTGSDTNLAYAAGDPNFGVNPEIGAAAYINSVMGAVTTTLFAIDTTQDTLVRQGGANIPPGTPSPNGGQLFTLGALAIDPSDDATRVNLGFDIQQAFGVEVAYAAMTTNGTNSTLYRINLFNGASTAIGAIGPPATLLRALTLDGGVVFRNGFE